MTYHYTYTNIVSATPSEFDSPKDKIEYSFQKSKFGKIIIASTPKGICYIGFIEGKENAVNELSMRFPSAHFIEQENEIHLSAIPFMNGKFDISMPIKLHLKGTEFQQKVWEALLQIPIGKTNNYNEIAQRIGKPLASRAVGTAISKNPIAFIIPCHRVIHSNRNTGNYHWGSDRKREILEWELEMRS